MVDAVRSLFRGFADAHRAEDMDAYLQFFTPHAVWVSSRGVCFQGSWALAEYLR